jgi:hypothetical protein
MSARPVCWAVIVLMAMIVPMRAHADDTLQARVSAFIDAFNARQVDVMLDAVDERIELVWLDSGAATVDTQGRDALRQFLTRYFAANADVHSQLTWISASHERVAAMETVSWTSADGRRSQSSLCVYEFNAGKIRRVWYFPAETAPATR